MKRTDVPKAWAGDPEGWWRHVTGCEKCSRFFEKQGDSSVGVSLHSRHDDEAAADAGTGRAPGRG